MLVDKTKIFAGIIIGAMATSVAVAADTDSCSKDTNNYIHPILALCTTHAYNAASSSNVGQNFSSDADRQNQRDIIAMKTTVITQQMKQQYDYLNATIRRLKTQLQKAVLTTSLEAAGASSDGSGSSSYNNNRNIVLTGAQDCSAQTTEEALVNCLQSNQVHIRAAINAANYNDAWNQLKVDAKLAQRWKIFGTKEGTGTGTLTDNCQKLVDGTKNRDVLEECLSDINIYTIQYRKNLNGADAKLQAIREAFGK